MILVLTIVAVGLCGSEPRESTETPPPASSLQWSKPKVTPRSVLPIVQAGVAHVDPAAACPPGLGTGAIRLSAIIDPPLIDYVEPDVPEGAQPGDRVIVELAIAPDGSVTGAKALRGDSRLLGAVAAAAKRWRFARTCLGGRAIPLVKVFVLSLQPSELDLGRPGIEPGTP